MQLFEKTRAGVELTGERGPDQGEFLAPFPAQGGFPEYDVVSECGVVKVFRVNAFRVRHTLALAAAHEDLLLEHRVHGDHVGVRGELFQQGAVGRETSSRTALYPQVRVEVGEIALYHGVEAVADREYEYEGGGPYSHTGRADCRNDVDDVVGFLGKQVTQGYEKSGIHGSGLIS